MKTIVIHTSYPKNPGKPWMSILNRYDLSDPRDARNLRAYLKRLARRGMRIRRHLFGYIDGELHCFVRFDTDPCPPVSSYFAVNYQTPHLYVDHVTEQLAYCYIV